MFWLSVGIAKINSLTGRDTNLFRKLYRPTRTDGTCRNSKSSLPLTSTSVKSHGVAHLEPLHVTDTASVSGDHYVFSKGRGNREFDRCYQFDLESGGVPYLGLL